MLRTRSRLSSAVRTLATLSILVAVSAFGASAQAQPFAPEVGGEWTAPIAWPHVPVSMANLPDGRVLTFASNERDSFPSGRPEFTYAGVWDPETNIVTEIPHPSHDMFCASLVMLEDGSVFISGGRNQGDSPWTSLFDFRTDSWIPIENMNEGRWYPTSVAMPTGEVAIFGGIGAGQHPEVWTPGSGWVQKTGINLQLPMLQYGLIDGAGLWPLLQLDPRGKIFHAGATPEMHEFDPLNGTGSFVSLGPHNQSWFPDEGVSVLYDEAKMLVAGGTETATVASDQAYTIDLSGPAPVLSAAAPMNERRQFQNEIMLPNGHVLVVGGNTDGRKFNDDNAVLTAEAWDPDADTWILMNPQAVPRTYHSTATLLTDGRVLSAGGGLSGGNPSVNHWDGEIFSPPYLFEAGGGLATRPVITAAPKVVRAGVTFEVEATPGLAEFSLVKMSATTHTMNTDLRFLRPGTTETTSGHYDLTLPSNVNVLTPGYWMLFGMNAAGVPSVSAVVQVVSTGVPQGEPIADRRNHVGDPVLLQVEAEDPDGNPLTFSALGLPPGLSIDPASGLISGVALQTGLYPVAVTADDGTESGVFGFQWVVADAFSEVGTVTVTQNDANQWHPVSFQNVYADPIVVMGPPSFGSTEPTTVRVDQVTPTGFQFQIDEWDYLDGSHAEETVSYLVVDAGSHLLPNGAALVAGRADGTNTTLRSVTFPSGAFTGAAPAVLTQAASANGSEAVDVRLTNIATTGFMLALQEQEAGDGVVADDTVHYIAIEPGIDPGVMEVGTTGSVVDEVWESVTYAQTYTGAPHLLGSIQTFFGTDTAALRHRNATASGVEFRVEEEQSANTEVGHVDENVGYAALDPSVTSLDLLPLFNTAPELTNPGNQQNAQGESISLLLQASDADGDVLAYSANGLPTGLSIDTITGEISGTLMAAGVFDVEVIVTDSSSASDTGNFDWTVGQPVALETFPTPPVEVGTDIDYTAQTDIPGSYDFTWDFGDGTPPIGPGGPSVSHTFRLSDASWSPSISSIRPPASRTRSSSCR